MKSIAKVGPKAPKRVAKAPAKARTNVVSDSKAQTGYRFLDKDPEIDVVREANRKSGMTWKEVAEKSGISVSTLISWDKGITRRPQNLTIRFAMEAMGYRQGEWVKIS